MAKRTLHDRYCAGLERLGYTKLPTRNKYTMYTKPGSDRVFFVGHAGALRVGGRANAALSRPCSDTLKARVLEYA